MTVFRFDLDEGVYLFPFVARLKGAVGTSLPWVHLFPVKSCYAQSSAPSLPALGRCPDYLHARQALVFLGHTAVIMECPSLHSTVNKETALFSTGSKTKVNSADLSVQFPLPNSINPTPVIETDLRQNHSDKIIGRISRA